MSLIQDSVDLKSFEAFASMLEDMAAPLRDPVLSVPTWQSVIDVLQEMERGFFASSAGPNGEPWAPLKPYTVKKKGHGIILRETYELESSLIGVSGTSIREIQPKQLEFGTNRAWAWKHQEGFGRIPQRMFLGMTDEATEEVVDIVADAAVRMMFGEQ
jgi:phage gpG-like protein